MLSLSRHEIETIANYKENYKDNYKDFEGVRITPAILLFKDSLESDTIKLNFKIHNISDRPKTIRILDAKTVGFQFTTTSSAKFLAPGQSITRTVKYVSLIKVWSSIRESCIPIYVENKCFEYPVIIEENTCIVVVEPPEVNFGVIDMGTSPVTFQLTLKNEGQLPTKFSFDLGNNNLDLTVQPMKGDLNANSSLDIRVQVVAVFKGIMFSEFWLCGTWLPIRIPVTMNVNIPRLEVSGPNKTWYFTLVDFEHTYFGTNRCSTLVLQNVSNHVSYFLMLGEVNNKMIILQEAAKVVPAFNTFCFRPQEGSLSPFESRICTIEFKPRIENMKKPIWKSTTICSEEIEFLVFMVATRVQSLSLVQLEKAIQNHMKCSMEPTSQINGSMLRWPYETENDQEFEDKLEYNDDEKNLSLEETDKSDSLTLTNWFKMGNNLNIPLLRICLHGIAVHPHVELTPTEIHLGEVARGIPQCRVLAITNHNKYLPVYFSYEKIQAVNMVPPEGKIEPLKSVEVALTITSSAVGDVRKKVNIKILGKTEPFAEDRKLVTLCHVKLLLTYNTPSHTTTPEPKFNMGITPQITNEVGVFIDDISFDSPVKKPCVAMLRADLSKKRNWFQKQDLCTSNKHDTSDILKNPAAFIRTTSSPKKMSDEYRQQFKINKNDTSDILKNPAAFIRTTSSPKKMSDEYRQQLKINLEEDVRREQRESVEENIISGSTVYCLEKIPQSEIAIFQADPEVSSSSRKSRDRVSDHSFLPSVDPPMTKSQCSETIKSEQHTPSSSISDELRTGTSSTLPSMSSSESPSKATDLNVNTIQTDEIKSNCSHQDTQQSINSKKFVSDSSTEICITEEKIIREKAASYFQHKSKSSYNRIFRVRSFDLHSRKTSNQIEDKLIKKLYQKNNYTKALTYRKNSKTQKISDKSVERKNTNQLNRNAIGLLSSNSSRTYQSREEEQSPIESIEFKERVSFNSASNSYQGNSSIDKKSPKITCSPGMNIKSEKRQSQKVSNSFPHVQKEMKSLSTNITKNLSQIKKAKKKKPKKAFSSLQSSKEILNNINNATTSTDKPEINAKHDSDSVKKHELYTEIKSIRKHEKNTEDELQLETDIEHIPNEVSFQKNEMKNHHYSMKSDIIIHKQSTPAHNSRRSSLVSIKNEYSKPFQKSFVFLKNSYSTVYIDEALEAARKLLQENIQVTKSDYSEKFESKSTQSKQIVAFPNDMGRTLRRCPSLNKPRTIFTGIPRYSCPVDSSYTFTPEELATRKANNEKYIQYIRETRKKLKETITEDIKESSICINKVEQLWKSPKYTRMITLERECFTNKESLHPLTPLQLYNIRVKPRAINFGRVAPMSHIADCFSVENLNSFPITFAFAAGENGVSFPYGNRKIVKPNSKLCFKMVFYVESLGRHNGSMVYIINENHSFDVSIYAEVVPKSLALAQTMLEFKNMPYDVKNRPLFLTVGIVNNLKCYTDFHWEVPPSSNFNICPMKGKVPPSSTLQLCVTYTQDIIKPLSAELVMRSEMGEKMKLKCISYLKEPKYIEFFLKKLDLQELPLNLPTEHTVFAYNGSYCVYMFKVLNPELMPGIVVTPVSGIFKPRSIFPFLIHCQIKTIVKFEVTLQVQLERSKIMELTIVGSVGYPMVLLKPNELKLRRMSVNSKVSIRLKLLNKGTTIAKVKFLLHDTEYDISTSPDIFAPKENDKDEYILEPGKGKSLFLHFTPHDIATYTSTLPIIINDILGPVELGRSDTMLTQYYVIHNAGWFNQKIVPLNFPQQISFIHVKCTVTNHILSISKTHVNLTHQAPECKTYDTVCLKNKLDHDILIKIDTRDICAKDCNFVLSIEKENVERPEIIMKLHASQSQNLHFMFCPKLPGNYTLNLPIFVDEYEGLYNSIHVEGSFPNPTIETNVTEIYFPPIPLGIECMRSINLTVSNYRSAEKINTCFITDNLDIKSLADKLLLVFPQGNKIQPNEPLATIPVTIIFKSNTTISFTTIIRFSDNHGTECSIKVTASADNCILSTYTFLKEKNSLYELNSTSEISIEDEYSTENEVNTLLKKTINFPSHSESEVVECFTSISCKKSPARKCSIRSAPVPICFSSIIMTPEVSSNLSTLSFNALNGDQNETEDHLIQSENGMSYPYPKFPHKYDETNMAKYLYNILESTEWWLYNVGFHSIYAPILPHGMSVLVSDDFLENKFNSQKCFPTKTIIDLLHELKAPQIIKKINKSQIPDTPVEQVLYIHKVYKNLIEYLIKHKACLAHLKPSHLLCYKDYVMYMTRVPYNPHTIKRETVVCDLCDDKLSSLRDFCSSHNSCHTLLSKREFTAYAKQAWMDLVLQIHKILILSKISPETEKLRKTRPSSETMSSHCSKPPLKEPENTSTENGKMNGLLNDSVYGSAEYILLNWLQNHFKIQQTVLWKPSEFKTPPNDREVSNFCKDLSDGLVFAAVTASYCPYLTNLLSEVYPHPLSEEESIHNAIKVIKAWETVKLGFTIRPQDIVNPNPVKMVLLISYLYEMLPSCIPRDTIYFNAELCRKDEQFINLNNTTDKLITYGVVILGNPLGLFKLKSSDNIVTVDKYSSTDISVTYTAKLIQPARATIIFYASTAPTSHVHNVTFELMTECTTLTVHDTQRIYPALYTPKESYIEIIPPYNEEAEYDIYLTEIEPTTSEKLNAFIWHEIAARRLPRRFFIKQDKIFKHATDKAMHFHFLYYCIIPETKNYWVIFRNEAVGDFIVKLIFLPNTNTVIKTINIELPSNWSVNKCKCEELHPDSFELTEGCYLRTKVTLPRQNKLLWKFFKQILDEVNCSDEEKQFWSKYMETNIGLQLGYYLTQNDDTTINSQSSIFSKSVTYNITTTKKNHILTPKKIHIPDILAADTISLPIHVFSDLETDLKVKLTFESESQAEIRNYDLVFHKQENNVEMENKKINYWPKYAGKSTKCASTKNN